MPVSSLPVASIPRRVSLVSQTVDTLRMHLQAGHWPERLPAERELSQHLQISRPTLRAALHELQRKGVIKLSGRVRRSAATKPASAKRPSSGYAVSFLSPFPLQSTSRLVLFLRDQLASAGYTVHFHVDPLCFSSKPARALEKMVRKHPETVWVAIGSKEPMQRWFLQRRLPLLVFGSCQPGIALASVDADYRATCRHAGDLLWRKGHRRLAFVIPQNAYDGDRESERGFREAINKHPEANLSILRHDETATHLCSLLDKALLSPNPPTAFFVARAVHALTVTMHLMRRKLRLPQDVAVLSRDDDSYLYHTSPILTRYSINHDLFVSKVSKAVRELTETGNLAPRSIRLISQFIAGETL